MPTLGAKKMSCQDTPELVGFLYLWPNVPFRGGFKGDDVRLDPVRVEILQSAIIDRDDIFVAVFDDPTPHEEALEREAMRMADEGLLSLVSAGQYRITAQGRSALDAHNRTPLRRATDGATTLAKQAETNYVRPILIGIIVAVIVALILISLGVDP
jgi:hypothetical protein